LSKAETNCDCSISISIHINIFLFIFINKKMKKIYEFRDELMRRKIEGFTQFYIDEKGKYFSIDEFIKEVDELRVCSCPPTVNKD